MTTIKNVRVVLFNTNTYTQDYVKNLELKEFKGLDAQRDFIAKHHNIELYELDDFSNDFNSGIISLDNFLMSFVIFTY